MSYLTEEPLSHGEILILEAVRQGKSEPKTIHGYIGEGVSKDQLYTVIEALVQKGFLEPTQKYGSQYMLTMKGVDVLVKYSREDEAEELRKTIEKMKKSVITEKVIAGSTGGGVLVGIGISLFAISFIQRIAPNLQRVLTSFLSEPQFFTYAMFTGTILIVVGIVLALKR